MPDSTSPRSQRTLRSELYRIIFEHDTFGGRAFDVALLVCILVSLVAVLLESVAEIRDEHGRLLRGIEWFFTIAFTLEYLLRLYSAGQRFAYARSFFGVVDLIAILPSYLSFLVPGAQSLLVVRVLRLLRVFRVLKLVQFYGQGNVLLLAVVRSLPKITVFLGVVLSVVVIMGSTMYLVEGPEHGFENIPVGMYWAIVTMSTVGFGDITPQTAVGRFLASLLMVLGYGIIAVPTGIVSSELLRGERAANARRCPACDAGDHASDAAFCRRCGAQL